ncbi:hypothetical protein CcaCcLH18_06999 [Colletotrichum camelliae]|nr:hypothetical protein CcaCcLH18_06999 [Colletotrichum camelliae]
MSSKEIRGAAIELIEAATHRRREEMIIKLGREFYDLSAAHNRAKLDSFVDLRSPVNGGEQDTNGETSTNSNKASANSNEEEEKETATPPSSVDQQTADDTSVTWELLDPETGSKCPDMKERDGEKARVVQLFPCGWPIVWPIVLAVVWPLVWPIATPMALPFDCPLPTARELQGRPLSRYVECSVENAVERRAEAVI